MKHKEIKDLVNELTAIAREHHDSASLRQRISTIVSPALKEARSDSVWVVEALRHGDREMHSYVVGVNSEEGYAKFSKQVEESWRGGKYTCEVREFKLDSSTDGKLKVMFQSLGSNGEANEK